METVTKIKLPAGTVPLVYRKYKLRKLLENFGIMSALYPKKYQKIWDKIIKLKIKWKKESANDYFSRVNDSIWRIKMNDRSKGEPIYTLWVDKEAILSFETLPTTWQVNN